MKRKIIESLMGIYYLFIIYCTANTLVKIVSIFTDSDIIQGLACIIGISIPILCIIYIANEESKQKDERDRIIAREINKIYNLLTDEQKEEYKKMIYKETSEERIRKWNEYMGRTNNENNK